ncbi:MAG: MerR family transcriptional regulator [Solirubrobacteraceae bacterium]
MSEKRLLIGQVARRAGLRRSAIRYYESIGLLAEPERVSGRRTYSPDVLRTLSMIGTVQRAGLTLGEIRQLLSTGDASGAVSARLRIIARHKLPELDALIASAVLSRSWLEGSDLLLCDA